MARLNASGDPHACDKRCHSIIILDRAGAFEDHLERQLAGLATGGPGVGHAVELFVVYVQALRAQIDEAWDSAADDEMRLSLMRRLLDHLNFRIRLFDDRLSRGHARVPRCLISAVERECEIFGLPGRQAVLTIGPPGNFVTMVSDLKKILLEGVQPPPPIPDHLEDFHPVLIAIPELEGTRPGWQPVIMGHELAHYCQTFKPIAPNPDIFAALDRRVIDTLKSPLPATLPIGFTRMRLLQHILGRWLKELICDAYAVHRYGAAGAAAIAEFLQSVGAADICGASHPPGKLRDSLMRHWLGKKLSTWEESLVESLQKDVDAAQFPDWATYLSNILLGHASNIWADVETWVGGHSCLTRERSEIVEWLAEQFESGIPGSESYRSEGTRVMVESADIINASWLAKMGGCDKPVDRLAAKALDDLDFLEKWQKAGGLLADYAAEPIESNTSVTAASGALVSESILARLQSFGADAIRVTPQLPDSVHGASMDVRLGNHFIIFQQSSAASFDALDSSQDPRSMQFVVEKSWGESFYLHPGQLVLAATLEYIALPADLTAQVVTRSSYGRLGLLSATAVQVHPHYVGCLTLELVNLGEMPLTITPGERIAQLSFFMTSLPLASSSNVKYRYPTGPEFSRISIDNEVGVLGEMRRSFAARQRPRFPRVQTR